MLQSLVAGPIPHPAGSAASRHAPNPIFPHPVFCRPICLPTCMLSQGAVPPSNVALAPSHSQVHLVDIQQMLAGVAHMVYIF